MEFWSATIKINSYIVCEVSCVRDYITKAYIRNSLILVFW